MDFYEIKILSNSADLGKTGTEYEIIVCFRRNRLVKPEVNE